MRPGPTLFRVLTYNIHKGFSLINKFRLDDIRSSIIETHSDLCGLQEVVGENHRLQKKHSKWPKVSQMEFLADKIWPHFSYGKNSISSEGHHGNAILSKYSIIKFEKIDISTNRFEQRGLLYACIDLTDRSHPDKKHPADSPRLSHPLHVYCTHLNLTDKGRKKQCLLIQDYLKTMNTCHEPTIFLGDFNDWNFKVHDFFTQKLEFKEAFQETKGRVCPSFPVQFPILSLDRIYFKNLEVKKAQIYSKGKWKDRSDHAALSADFKLF